MGARVGMLLSVPFAFKPIQVPALREFATVDRTLNKLNPLLKLAAISGVETAVKLHIRRGDDLDARDGSGATPLILAASKGHVGAVRLLLDAGADPTLVDENGMDALAHAAKSGSTETAELLEEALSCSAAPQFPEKPAGEIPGNLRDKPATPVLDDEPLGGFLADEWEAEEEPCAPEGDSSVADAAREIHAGISRHKVVDRDESWGDVEIYLPVRAVPIMREEGDRAVRELLLAALREGMIPESRLTQVCANADGSRNEEAEKLLAIVIGELGAVVAKWMESDEAFVAEEPTPTEECLLRDAEEFAKDLASGNNDPFKFYAKDIRGNLLGAEGEIALSREMEEAARAALFALASWPEGMSAVFDAADLVARGDADVELFCTGPEISPDRDVVVLPLEIGDGESDDDDDEAVLDEDAVFFVNAIAAVKAVRGDARKTAEALENARLTRGFLMGLADKAIREQAGRDFAEAIGRQVKARERMILCNLRLALSIAKKYRWSGMPLDDLVQEANIGLIKAVERYDWRRGFRFSTYATWWIRQQVTRSIADKGRVVRVPVHIQEKAWKILRERQRIEARLDHPETEVETARRIGMPLDKTRMLLTMFEDVVSLDEVEPDTGLSRVDGLVDDMSPNPAEVVERTSLRKTLLGMLDDLGDERVREVILLRFGFVDDDAMTLQEVGQYFGVTRERIRQIEAKALRMLRYPSRSERLRSFLDNDS